MLKLMRLVNRKTTPLPFLCDLMPLPGCLPPVWLINYLWKWVKSLRQVASDPPFCFLASCQEGCTTHPRLPPRGCFLVLSMNPSQILCIFCTK